MVWWCGGADGILWIRISPRPHVQFDIHFGVHYTMYYCGLGFIWPLVTPLGLCFGGSTPCWALKTSICRLAIEQ